METLLHLLDALRHPDVLLASLGAWGTGAVYAGMALIVFLETGAMVFFLPGDSLLVTAGLFCATRGNLDLSLVNLLLIPAAILGDATSYTIGRRAGPHLFQRQRSRMFRPEHVQAAHDFYEKHGGKAIIIARFMPLVRTFVPVIAGVAGMTYRQFAVFNVVGAAAWVFSMTLLGYTLGVAFPAIVKHTELLVGVVVVLSLMPGAIQFVRSRGRVAPAPAPTDE